MKWAVGKGSKSKYTRDTGRGRSNLWRSNSAPV